MGDITALFWDVGGVLLTNGWDASSRREATRRFGLDWEDFEDRHQLVVAAFETGRMSLDEYLQRTVFEQPRAFGAEEFKAFMFAQSSPHQDAIALVDRLARTGRYLLATINNEPLELNLYRIQQFELRRYFAVFFSSCFLGVKKPEDAIFRLALHITQRDPAESLFIDDRPLNLECAGRLGMRTVHYQHPEQLHCELRAAGIEI